MITKTIIKILREDSTIQSLLGAADTDSCPVFTTFNFQDTLDKQINITLEYGETIAFDQTADTHDGRMIIYVLVRDTVSGAINIVHEITNRILALLDIQGTTLDTSSTVYWVQKMDTDFTHYEDIKYYELAITFRFVITEQ
jgi:hypothetical protein